MSDEQLYVFPTSGRDKHGKNWSYPIGAEALSRALVGVAQPKAFSVRLRMTAPIFIVGRKGKIIIFEITQINPRNPSLWEEKRILERRWPNKTWDIAIYSVPRNSKNKIRSIVEKFLIMIFQIG
jgi:hypothetical protein